MIGNGARGGKSPQDFLDAIGRKRFADVIALDGRAPRRLKYRQLLSRLHPLCGGCHSQLLRQGDGRLDNSQAIRLSEISDEGLVYFNLSNGKLRR